MGTLILNKLENGRNEDVKIDIQTIDSIVGQGDGVMLNMKDGKSMFFPGYRHTDVSEMVALGRRQA